jgi:hypothetical protein
VAHASGGRNFTGAFDPIRSVPLLPLLALGAMLYIWKKELA